MPTIQIIVTNMSKLIRSDTIENEPHWVVPVILIAEGVHNDVLYPSDELKKFPTAWDGIPIPVQHPTKEGMPITANSPDLEKYNVGRIYNTKFEDGKLKAEAWLAKNKIEKIAPEIKKMLENNEMIEVSTGVFVEVTNNEGKWNGETYKGIAANYRPDHLALLPGGTGACSIKDGAGMPRINSSKFDLDKILRVEIFKLENNEISFWKKEDQRVIYSLIKNKDQLLERKYTFDKKLNELHINGEVEEVVSEVNFVSVNNLKGKKMERKKAVEMLIANEANKWDEKDSEFLMGLEDDQFKKLEEEKEVKEEEKKKLKVNKEKEIEKKAEELIANREVKAKAEAEKKAADEKLKANKGEEKKKAITADEYLANAPKEYREVLQDGLKLHQEKKETLVEALVKNERCKFSKEQLEGKNVAELAMLIELANVVVDHTAKGGTSPKINADRKSVV